MSQNSGLMRGKHAPLRGTGQVHHVNSACHVVGMKRPDARDIPFASSAAKE